MSKQKMCVALLLDRSGSMSVNKIETISAVNSYIDKTKEKFKGRFVLTQFDSEGIDIVHDGKIKDIEHLTDKSYQPRGMTPLLDAIGKTLDLRGTHVPSAGGDVTDAAFVGQQRVAEHRHQCLDLRGERAIRQDELTASVKVLR